HRLMDELHCNKLALGQHLTDLCASFLISLCRGGGLKTMGPNVPADGGKARLIRPLWSNTKKEIHACAQLFAFPSIRSCPYEKALEADGDRARMEKLIDRLEEEIPDLQASMRQSMGDIRLAHLLDRRFAPDFE
ncbi:MAG: hypothetical protein J6S21_01925, partial [Victivallales bacterium]|nr:hypothetical protein [Victivallales bacterium]